MITCLIRQDYPHGLCIRTWDWLPGDCALFDPEKKTKKKNKTKQNKTKQKQTKTLFKHVWWIYHTHTQKKDSKVLEMAIKVNYFDEKMATSMLEILDGFSLLWVPKYQKSKLVFFLVTLTV